jgi:hypothetical protein
MSNSFSLKTQNKTPQIRIHTYIQTIDNKWYRTVLKTGVPVQTLSMAGAVGVAGHPKHGLA